VHRFTDMHHALLRDTSRESAKAVCEVIGSRAR
jgi:lipid-A-disaccharide synthase